MAHRLYLSCFHQEALIASQYDPEEFGTYMAVGPKRHSSGMVMFIEIDESKLDPSKFNLKRAADEMAAADARGVRKASKYISIYRVLEHVPLAAMGALHLVTRDGRTLSIRPTPFLETGSPRSQNLYLEVCPLQPLVASHLGPGDFIRFMTSPSTPLHVPRMLLADLLIDRDADGRLAGNLPYRNPEHIVDCLDKLSEPSRTKASKTVDRSPHVDAIYRMIRRGLFLGDQTGIIQYVFPSRSELNAEHFRWWRSASL